MFVKWNSLILFARSDRRGRPDFFKYGFDSAHGDLIMEVTSTIRYTETHASS
jgi:hypothetical protein